MVTTGCPDSKTKKQKQRNALIQLQHPKSSSDIEQHRSEGS
jgi:hypothetical protein